jgi:hypothetical protein
MGLQRGRSRSHSVPPRGLTDGEHRDSVDSVLKLGVFQCVSECRVLFRKAEAVVSRDDRSARVAGSYRDLLGLRTCRNPKCDCSVPQVMDVQQS